MKNNKTVIITGGGTGIGKGIALKLAKNNFNIILASRNISNLQKVKEECNKLNNHNVITVQTDVTDSDSVSNLFDIVKDKFKKLDVLINNAGVFDGGPVDKLDIETWDKVLNINLRGAFLCLREAMKIMKPQKSGKIINIGQGQPLLVKEVIKKINMKIGSGIPEYGKIKFRKDEIINLYPNIRIAKKILKWKPKISFNKGINLTIKYYKSELKKN